MIHVVIVRDPVIFQLIREQAGAKKGPLPSLPYQVFSHFNIRIIGGYEVPVEKLLASVIEEFNPDTVFFLSESYPVSDEKLSGDIVLPNVFFPYNPEIEAKELGKDTTASLLSNPIFLEHYPVQGDYNFESFGLSVGGVHVSGEWNTEMEDFRIRLRVVYENDTFDPLLYRFIETAQKEGIQEKMYPVAYIGTEDTAASARSLWSIVQFIIGSIDPDLIPEEETAEREDEEEWVDGKEEE